MDQKEREKVLKRLKKVLALSESSNAGEAAAALHQANLIMQKYGLSSVDCGIYELEESSSALTSSDLRRWESSLIGVVAKAIGVAILIQKYEPTKGIRRNKANVIFIGEAYRSKIAVYAFESLRKKLRMDLKQSFNQMLDSALPPENREQSFHLKISAKQRDIYAFAWCESVSKKVHAIAPSNPEAVEAYIESRLTPKPPTNEETNQKRRTRKKTMSPIDTYLYRKGINDGKNVSLHHGVDGNQGAGLQLIESQFNAKNTAQ
jgi:Protein of unknown function (DUF2786)